MWEDSRWAQGRYKLLGEGKISYSWEEWKADHPARKQVTILVELNRLFIDYYYYEKLPSQKLNIFTDAEYRKPVTSSSKSAITSSELEFRAAASNFNRFCNVLWHARWKTAIMEPERTADKHFSVATNTSRHNRWAVVKGVSHWVRPEAI
jgi:hypothetical protein